MINEVNISRASPKSFSKGEATRTMAIMDSLIGRFCTFSIILCGYVIFLFYGTNCPVIKYMLQIETQSSSHSSSK